MDLLEKELTKAYEIKTEKVGFGIGYKNQGKVLNRVLRCAEGGWEMEADPRHAELVVEQVGLKDDKGIGTPGLLGADEDDNDDDVPLTGTDITNYRGLIARCNYIASDRPDRNFAIKECCREMSAPTARPLKQLMMIGSGMGHIKMQQGTPTSRNAQVARIMLGPMRSRQWRMCLDLDSLGV